MAKIMKKRTNNTTSSQMSICSSQELPILSLQQREQVDRGEQEIDSPDREQQQSKLITYENQNKILNNSNIYDQISDTSDSNKKPYKINLNPQTSSIYQMYESASNVDRIEKLNHAKKMSVKKENFLEESKKTILSSYKIKPMSTKKNECDLEKSESEETNNEEDSEFSSEYE
jgi:hypothetical protein